MKRYFAVIWSEARAVEALVLCNEKHAKIIKLGKRIGFAIDYYPEEKQTLLAMYGQTIVGDYATRLEAEAAAKEKLGA